jgi:hypothetical protein
MDQWKSIDIKCWNYRKNSEGYSTQVTINKKCVCTSDCECTHCPLHKSNHV